MDIVPKLNLTDNYKDVDNMSLVGARNIMLDKNGILTFDKGVEENEVITNAISLYFGNESYDIIYCISCNKEIIIFVAPDLKQYNKLTLFRYNEELNQCKKVIDSFAYNGGQLIGDFTYNKSDLIIIISEYFNDNSKKIPLRTINLGDFNKQDFINTEDNDQLTNSDLHSVLPKVIIPNITYNLSTGFAQKGWHFIFIRYKISSNTYTQWYSTNESIFLDTFNEDNIADYRYSNYWNENSKTDDEDVSGRHIMKFTMSNYKEFSDYTYILKFNNLDHRYKKYQIGVICINKGNTKAYINEDIDINTNIVKFINFKNYNKIDILTSYNNYYNVKSLSVINNKVYIGNYKEFEEFINTDNIEVEISAKFTRPAYVYNDSVPTVINDVNILNYSTSNTTNIEQIPEIEGAPENTPPEELLYYDVTCRIPTTDISQIKSKIREYSVDINGIKNSGLFVSGVFTCIFNNGPRDNIDYGDDRIFTRHDSINNQEFVSLIFSLKTEYVSANLAENGYQEPLYGNNYLIYTVLAEQLGLLVGYEIEYVGNDTYKYNPIGNTEETGNSRTATAKSLCIFNNGRPIAPWLKFSKDSPDNQLTAKLIDNNFKEFEAYGRVFIDVDRDYREWLGISFKKDYIGEYYNANIEIAEGYSTHNIADVIFSNFDLIFSDSSYNAAVHTDLIKGDNTVNLRLGFVCEQRYYDAGWLQTNRFRVSHNNNDFESNPLSLCTFEAPWFISLYGGKAGENVENIPEIDDSIPSDDIPDDELPIQKIYPNEIAKLLSAGLSLNEYYSFYINFVNEYGEISKAYPISLFKYKFINETEQGIELIEDNSRNVTDSKRYVNKDIIKGKYNDLICLLDDKDYISYGQGSSTSSIKKYYLEIKLLNLPKGYCGYFISHEKIDKNVIYSGFLKFETDIQNNYHYKFYSDALNYNDTIDFSFTHAKLSMIQLFNDGTGTKVYGPLADYTNLIEMEITKKEIVVADQLNNICYGTYLKLEFSNSSDYTFNTNSIYFVQLINKNHKTKYSGNSKHIIPCSQISYGNPVIANPKTVFHSTTFAIEYFGYLYDSTNKIFKAFNNQYAANKPFMLHKTAYKQYIPTESLTFNNKPQIVIAPTKGLNSDDEKVKFAYIESFIIEAKNSIDLFQQKQLSYDNANPLILNHYNTNIITTDYFPNTIRRSNIIQDESNENAWRKFYAEQYKNITENKGEIIKIFGLGDRLYIHTKHSLFLFDSTDTIASDKNGIQLQSIDTWETKYKEIFPTKLGFGGINKEDNGIVGIFGYIWFDAGEQAFYRIDEQNKFEKISVNIEKHIKLLNIIDVAFIDDKENMRLIILLKDYLNRRGVDTISYNYGINAFISTHHYSFDFGASTKNGCYIISGNIYNYTDNKDINKLPIINRYINKISNSYRFIDIIYNANYNIIKYLDSIKFNIISIVNKKINDEFNTIEKEIDKTMANDYIKIFNEYCDTGILDIASGDDFINEISDYTKPVFMLGNWHFNYIRNNLANYETNGNINNDDVSRFYGRYFIVRFIYSNIVVDAEFNSIDFNLINDN